MAESENIGSVNVSIGGDYSPLLDAIKAGEQVAAAGGKTIAEALTVGFDNVKGLGASFEEQMAKLDAAAGGSVEKLAQLNQAIDASVAAGASWANAVDQVIGSLESVQQPVQADIEQLNLFADAMDAIPFADATGQLNMFTDELEPLAGAASEASQSVSTFSDGLQSLAAQQQDADQALATATSTLQEAVQAYQQGAISEEVLVRATNDYDQALAAANPKIEKQSEDVATLSDRFIALGEALAITEGLKLFGERALEVAAEQEKLEISLERLQGSAEAAESSLKQIDQFSFKNALNIDTVEAATQRMYAFGFSASEVQKTLQAAADAAAATGGSFESVANRIENMALSGMAGARQLTALGISADDLGKVLGVTGEQAAAAFKALDQPDRIVAIDAALEKFKGTSEAVAQGLSGQWQELQNHLHNLFEEIGKTLAPVATEVLGILNNDILPAVKGVVHAFEELPAPLRDFITILGLVVAAAAPVAAGIGGLALGLQGLQKLIPITTGLLETLGITAGATAVGEDAVAAASTRMAAAEAAAATSTGLLGTALAAIPWVALGVSVLQLADAYFKLRDAQSGLDQTQAELQKTADKMVASLRAQGINVDDQVTEFNNAINAGKDYGLALQTLQQELHKLSVEYNDQHATVAQAVQNDQLLNAALKDIVKTSGEETQAYNTAKAAFDAVVASMKNGTDLYKGHKADAQDYAIALDKLNQAAAKIPAPLSAVTLAMANDTQAAQKATQAHQVAAQVFQQTLAAFNAGVATYAQVASAQDKLSQSEAAAAAAGAPIPGTLQAIDLAARSVTSTMAVLASSHDIAAAKALAQSDSLRNLEQDVLVASQKLVLLTIAQHDAQEAADSHRMSEDQLRTITNAVTAAAADLEQKQEALALAQIRAQNAAAAQRGEVGLLDQALKEANLAVDQAKTKMDAGSISAAAYAAAERAGVAATIALDQAIAEEAANVGRQTDSLSLLNAQHAAAKAKVDDLTLAYKEHLASVQDLISARKAELDSQIALDQEAAIQATGLATATDRISMLKTAVAAAQAKYDDLKQAVEGNLAPQRDLMSAEQALKSAQDALTQAVSDSHQPLEQATSDLDNQTQAALRDADALRQAAGGFKSLADEMAASKPDSFQVNSAGALYYNPQDVPYYKGDLLANKLLAQSMRTSGLVQPGQSMTQQQLNDLIAKLQAVADQLGGNPQDALARVEQYYETHGFQIPSAADFGVSAKSGSSQPSSSPAPSGYSTNGQMGSSSTYMAGTLDTAAAGGTYPGVVIHQAAGEILMVAMASTSGYNYSPYASAGGTASSDSATSALAASSTAAAVSQAAGTISNVIGALVSLNDSIANVAGQIQQVAAAVSKNVPGQVQTLTGPKPTTSSTKVPPQSINVGSSPTNISVGAQGNGFLPTAAEALQHFQQQQQWANQGYGAPPSTAMPTAPSPGAAVGPISTVTLTADFSGANFSGADPAAVKAAVSDALQDAQTRMLRDMGARF